MWGITVHSGVIKYALGEQLHMHSRRQPTFIANEMFQLSIQPSIIVFEKEDVYSNVLLKQDSDNTDQEMSDDDR